MLNGIGERVILCVLLKPFSRENIYIDDKYIVERVILHVYNQFFWIFYYTEQYIIINICIIYLSETNFAREDMQIDF